MDYIDENSTEQPAAQEDHPSPGGNARDLIFLAGTALSETM